MHAFKQYGKLPDITFFVPRWNCGALKYSFFVFRLYAGKVDDIELDSMRDKERIIYFVAGHIVRSADPGDGKG